MSHFKEGIVTEEEEKLLVDIEAYVRVAKATDRDLTVSYIARYPRVSDSARRLCEKVDAMRDSIMRVSENVKRRLAENEFEPEEGLEDALSELESRVFSVIDILSDFTVSVRAKLDLASQTRCGETGKWR